MRAYPRLQSKKSFFVAFVLVRHPAQKSRGGSRNDAVVDSGLGITVSNILGRHRARRRTSRAFPVVETGGRVSAHRYFSGDDELGRLFCCRNFHRQNACLLIAIDIEKFAKGRLDGSHRIAQLIEPVAPELLDRRYVVSLTNLAQDVFPQRGKVKAAQHGAPGIAELDLFVHIDTEEVLAERALLAILGGKAYTLLEGDGARKNFGVIRQLQ